MAGGGNCGFRFAVKINRIVGKLQSEIRLAAHLALTLNFEL
jgi:hypothetical protein